MLYFIPFCAYTLFIVVVLYYYVDPGVSTDGVVYLGCYVNDDHDMGVEHEQSVMFPNARHETCREICLRAGTRYMGLEVYSRA